VFYPLTIRGTAPGAAYYCFQVLAFRPDYDPDLRIYFLHVSTHPSLQANGFPPENWPIIPAGDDVSTGTPVSAWTVIGRTGPAVSGTNFSFCSQVVQPAPHLHLEFQRMMPLYFFDPALRWRVSSYEDASKASIPVDPYGWLGGTDPYVDLLDLPPYVSGIESTRIWQ
jgi:hypothetical protein